MAEETPRTRTNAYAIHISRMHTLDSRPRTVPWFGTELSICQKQLLQFWSLYRLLLVLVVMQCMSDVIPGICVWPRRHRGFGVAVRALDGAGRRGDAADRLSCDTTADWLCRGFGCAAPRDWPGPRTPVAGAAGAAAGGFCAGVPVETWNVSVWESGCAGVRSEE